MLHFLSLLCFLLTSGEALMNKRKSKQEKYGADQSLRDLIGILKIF